MFRKDLLIYSIRDGTDGLTILKKKKNSTISAGWPNNV
jgi:hypothetical protein